jgi:FkbM family methyltransferase
MTAAELLARARGRRLVPNRLARPAFWRLAIRNQDALSEVVVESDVRFDKKQLRLRLELASRQTWPMLFQGFDSSGEGDMIRLFCDRARRARCVIDVGVNHGLYLYHAVACCPRSAVIVGVEANPVLVESVNSNLRRNGLDRLVELAALTDADGLVELHIGKDDMVSSLRADHVDGFGGAISTVVVPGFSLDTLVTQRGLCPDLIKIDVEGHERAVLAGARQTLATHRPTLLIETTPETFEEVDAVLRAASYSGQLFNGVGLCEPERDIIAAFGHSNLVYECLQR